MEGLIHLNLFILKYRQLRADMTEVFKIIHNMMQNYHHSICLMKGRILEVITIQGDPAGNIILVTFECIGKIQ